MKNFFAIVITVALIFVLAVPTAAAHTHLYDFAIDDEEIYVFCYCGSKLFIPATEEAKNCEHEFSGIYSNTTHGKECIKCGFTQLEHHDFNEYFKDNNHILYCKTCGYEAYHAGVSYHDDTSHYFECFVCEQIFEHSMSARDVGKNFHYLECDECNYFVRETHNYDDDGNCIECQLFSGFVTRIIPSDDEYIVEVLVNDESFTYSTECEIGTDYINTLIDFKVYDGKIVEFYDVLNYYDFEAPDYLEENFKIGTVSDDFMFEFGNDKPLHDADVFLFNIKYGGYRVKSTNELILYEPVNPFLLPIVVPID